MALHLVKNTRVNALVTSVAAMFQSVKCLLVTLCIFAATRLVFATDDGYGTEWLIYVDETGVDRILNFSALPTDDRSWKYGNVYFLLYTRNNLIDPEYLVVPKNDSQLESKYFDASHETKVVTHGWLSNGNTSWIQDIKDSYLKRRDINVIAVDWSELASNPVYPFPACSTRYVGKRLAKLLHSLVNSFQAQGEQMHLIGHSLGAQIMGYAGMFFTKRVRRITGLDPARPLFEIPPMTDNFRLEKTDAEFVDIIHTCAGIYGYKYSHGHADYYPNSGEAPQPGCEGSREKIDACSHGRSHEYFAESIECGTPFAAYPCDSYKEFDDGNCKQNASLMGEPADELSRGNYYLHTKNESKYAEGYEE